MTYSSQLGLERNYSRKPICSACNSHKYYADALVKTLYTYMVASSTEWNRYEKDDIFVPNVFLDISEEIETKIRAMKCYKTECRLYPHPRSSKAIRAYAHYQGLTVGLEYAESFRLIRDMRG